MAQKIIQQSSILTRQHGDKCIYLAVNKIDDKRNSDG